MIKKSNALARFGLFLAFGPPPLSVPSYLQRAAPKFLLLVGVVIKVFTLERVQTITWVGQFAIER